ncbi:mechanosensitive ion channel family protein [bacterium]|nr:mechanosensitive ion channel family protein [bacterium]
MNEIISFIKTHPILLATVQTVLVFVVTWIAAYILPRIEARYIRRLVEKTKTDIDDKIVRLVADALGHFIWLAGFAIASGMLRDVISKTILDVLDHLIYVILVFLIARLIGSVLRILLEWYLHSWGMRTGRKIRDEFGPLFFRVLSILIYTIVIVEILHHFKQDVSSVIVSLGVGSLAVALAAKDTLANMIAGFMIMTDRPFRLGDRILLESGEKGDVFDIGLRTTKILTFENTLIIVPNHQIINDKVTNLSYPDPQIRVLVNVGVAYGSDIERVKEILVEICRKHTDVLDKPEPLAYFVNFGDSSLDLKLICRVSQWGEQWRVAEELRIAIYKKFEEEKIEIPFPQRDLNIKGQI